MDADQVLLSDDLLIVLRGAVTYAVEYGSSFVAPTHLLLSLLDDPKIGNSLKETVERGRIIAAARQPVAGGIVEVPEGTLPRGEAAPFVRYNTVVFHSIDGQAQRWFNRDTFTLFNESAKRAEGGRFQPKHLAAGYAVESKNNLEIRALLGREPDRFAEVAMAL